MNTGIFNPPEPNQNRVHSPEAQPCLHVFAPCSESHFTPIISNPHPRKEV